MMAKDTSVVIQIEDMDHRPRKKFILKNLYMRWFMAEFFGTLLLSLIGCSINMQYLLFRKQRSADASIWGCGLSVTMCVYVTFGISGGHLNPAVSMAFYTMGRMDIKSLLVYWLAQYVGSFCGAAVTYMVYYEAFYLFDKGGKTVVGVNATANIWSVYPHESHHVYTSFFDMVIATAMLLIFVLGIIDCKNTQVSRSVQPLLIGLVVVMILTALSYNCGAAINPARDFGPRVFSALAGWGVQVFTAHNYFFWVPIVSPHLGAILGALLYHVFISRHEPPYDDEKDLGEDRFISLSSDEDYKENKDGSEVLSERIRLTAADVKEKLSTRKMAA